MSEQPTFTRVASETTELTDAAASQRKEKRFVDIPAGERQVLALVNGLSLCFPPEMEPVVRQLSFSIQEGEILGLVGESGCGKSITAAALAGLLPDTAYMSSGEIYFSGHPLHAYDKAERRSFLGHEMTMVYQDPSASLNPMMRVGKQVDEALCIHQPQLPKVQRRDKVLQMLEKVQLPNVSDIYARYPHELSGGQRQRILLAMALINEPALLICDEPTTALDVYVRDEITSLLREVNQRDGTAILYISHDLHTVQAFCDRTIILYAGEVVEAGPTAVLFKNPRHIYTRRLLEAQPSGAMRGQKLASITGQVQSFTSNTGEQRKDYGCIFADRCPAAWTRCHTEIPSWQKVGAAHEAACHLNDPHESERWEAYQAAEAVSTSRQMDAHKYEDTDKGALVIKDLYAGYTQGRGQQPILNGFNLEIPQGCFMGLAGPSGSGKTTLARVLTGQMKPASGSVHLGTHSLLGLSAKERRREMTEIAMIFQDPHGSLHPSQTIKKQMVTPLRIHGERNADVIEQKVLEMMTAVGLPEDFGARYPDELSGGQRQRAAIGIALITEPRLLIADEAVSSLDVSIQAQILNLLLELRARQGFSCLFISHDLDVLSYVCDRISLLNEGQIVMNRPVDQLDAGGLPPFAVDFLERARRTRPRNEHT